MSGEKGRPYRSAGLAGWGAFCPRVQDKTGAGWTERRHGNTLGLLVGKPVRTRERLHAAT